jgi:hypothetical protein
VYFVPNGLNGSDGVVVRYDPQAAFTNASSWTTFDLTGARAGAVNFRGAMFDGRRLYFPQYAGLLGAFDTTASFTSAFSWTVFDTKTVSPDAFGFFGGAFDGRYVYFAPQTGSVVARFDARSTPAMPKLPAFYGSFL